MGGVVSINGSAIGLWKKLRVSMVGTLTKAFRHKCLSYRCLCDVPVAAGFGSLSDS
jgi:hypothetical protein